MLNYHAIPHRIWYSQKTQTSLAQWDLKDHNPMQSISVIFVLFNYIACFWYPWIFCSCLWTITLTPLILSPWTPQSHLFLHSLTTLLFSPFYFFLFLLSSSFKLGIIKVIGILKPLAKIRTLPIIVYPLALTLIVFQDKTLWGKDYVAEEVLHSEQGFSFNLFLVFMSFDSSECLLGAYDLHMVFLVYTVEDDRLIQQYLSFLPSTSSNWGWM